MPEKEGQRPVPTDREHTAVTDDVEREELSAEYKDEAEDAETEAALSAVRHEDDMEAAMEEDIAGESTGVSRRNPHYSAAPSMAASGPSFGPALPLRRSGSEEADWFNRFRERLVSQVHTEIHQAGLELGTEAASDPDDPNSDEALEYSEEG